MLTCTCDFNYHVMGAIFKIYTKLRLKLQMIFVKSRASFGPAELQTFWYI